MDDAERWTYLEEVRQGAIRVALRARAMQEYPRPRTMSAAALEDEMARRFAAEVVHLRDDLDVLPAPVPVAWWRRVLRRVAVRMWRAAV